MNAAFLSLKVQGAAPKLTIGNGRTVDAEFQYRIHFPALQAELHKRIGLRTVFTQKLLFGG